MDCPSVSFPPVLHKAASRAFSKLARLLPRPNRQPLCNLTESGTAPSCQNSICIWATLLLQSLVLPAHARARDPADPFMNDLMQESGSQRCALDSATAYPAVDRIVALGDIHGDLDAMRSCLQKASVIDENDAWVGGKTVLVQVGDQLDRGHKERDILKLLFELQDNAPSAGGAVHILLGNHELMNTRLDFRYVTSGGFQDFSRDGGVSTVFGKPYKSRLSSRSAKAINLLPKPMRSRAHSLIAGGPLAVELGQRTKVSVVVGDNVFVHAGLSPKHFKFGRDNVDAMSVLQDINDEAKKFLQGRSSYPMILNGGGSPVWMRDYSRPGVRTGSPECRMLHETLRLIGVKRMIVGHTPQAEGINSACSGKVWRIDTGMSRAYGGVPEAIEITRRGSIKIFTPNGAVQGSARYR